MRLNYILLHRNNMLNQKHTSKNGFTLIELLLYVAIAAVMLTMTIAFLSLLLGARIKNQVVAEVEQQGLAVMQVMTQAIRNAEGITSPATTTAAATTTLDTLVVGSDPTSFDLSSGTIRIQHGTSTPVALTNSQVTASGLSFYNLSKSGTPGTLRIQFTLTGVNQTGRGEYSYTKTFTNSATLRRP